MADFNQDPAGQAISTVTLTYGVTIGPDASTAGTLGGLPPAAFGADSSTDVLILPFLVSSTYPATGQRWPLRQ